jgi:tetratricopeptide (TPR) repeat protein
MTRHELEDERSFLLLSLEDLDREHEAGDLSDADHAVLRDGAPPSPVAPHGSDATRFRRRTPSGPPVVGAPRVRRRRLAVAAVVAVVLGCVVWAVADHVGARLPGETVTGSVTLTPNQQTARTLAQAETLESQGNAADALTLYESVLRRDPSQEEALAEAGWLEYEAGALARNGILLALGQGREQQAERVDPGAFAPHLYLGSMLLAQGDPAGAASEYTTFLADHPPSATVRSAAPFITKAFTDAHEVPPPLPVGASVPAG